MGRRLLIDRIRQLVPILTRPNDHHFTLQLLLIIIAFFISLIFLFFRLAEPIIDQDQLSTPGCIVSPDMMMIRTGCCLRESPILLLHLLQLLGVIGQVKDDTTSGISLG